MADVMMQLGDYQFGIDTAAYQDFSRSTEYRWSEQARLGQDDALQFTGNGADTVTLSGVVFPFYKGGTGQPDAMRAEAAKAKPLMLVDGLGKIHGRWVLTRVDESGSVFARGGIARQQSFTLNLRRFDDGQV